MFCFSLWIINFSDVTNFKLIADDKSMIIQKPINCCIYSKGDADCLTGWHEYENGRKSQVIHTPVLLWGVTGHTLGAETQHGVRHEIWNARESGNTTPFMDSVVGLFIAKQPLASHPEKERGCYTTTSSCWSGWRKFWRGQQIISSRQQKIHMYKLTNTTSFVEILRQGHKTKSLQFGISVSWSDLVLRQSSEPLSCVLLLDCN